MRWTNRRLKGHGIFLIGVMLVVLLIAMFVGASFELGVWGFKRNLSQSDLAAAQRAARSGLAYVLARLRNDATWKADTALTTVVNDPDLVVVEERGNIIGLLRNGPQTAQFRVRFNYYDGASGSDGMDDPSPAMKIDVTRVSVNNLAGTAAVTVPLANGPAGSVPASPTAYANLPSRGVFVSVEGRCGRWLSQATSTNPNPAMPIAMKASQSNVETVYKVVNPTSGSPAVASSAGNFSATVATSNAKCNISLASSDNAMLGRVRSRGNLDVVGGQAGKENLVGGKQGGQYGALGTIGTGIRPESSVVQVTEGAADPLLAVPWSKVDVAVPNVTPSVNVLPAGVYSVWQDGNLHYYDMDLPSYRALMTADQTSPGTVNPPLPASVNYTTTGSGAGLKAKFQIGASTFVQGTGATQDLTIIPKNGVDAGPGVVNPDFQEIATVTDVTRPKNVKVEFKPSTASAAVLSSTGKVNLGVSLSGDGGSITAEDNLNLVGIGVDLSAYSNPQEGVSLYTKKNLLMSTYDKGGATYKKVALKGVVYCWGDFQASLGHSSVLESKWGKFDLTGAMTAYGKDPSDLVSVPTQGKLDITAKEINLKFDPTYISGILSGLPADFSLQRVRWLQN